MLSYIKNIACLLVDVEGSDIPVSEVSVQLNGPVRIKSVYPNSRSFADIEKGKFRRLFDRHKVAYRF